MGLRIVWRNPIPSNCGDIPVERIADDESCTVYQVRHPGGPLVFEVFGCGFSRRRPRAHHVGESA
jgi:hypothetical protein